MAKQDEYTRYTIRIPQPLYRAIEKAALAANRSVNAEITQRLEFAMEEDIWERKQFIDNLNFKHHVINTQMHVLAEYQARMHSLTQEAKYERALRKAAEDVLAAVSTAIVADDHSPPQLSRIATTILSKQDDLTTDDLDRAITEMHRRIGDRSDVGSNWEDQLSEEGRQWLSEARKYAKPYE